MNDFPVSPSDIGFDIDGVVADTMGTFLRIARDEYGHTHLARERITSYWLEDCLDIPVDDVTAIIKRILDDPFETGLTPISGAGEALGRIAEHARLTFVTARPSADSIEEWMRRLLPRVPPSDIVVIATGLHARKKEVLAELGIGAFVEDHLDTCLDLHAAGFTSIVFDQPWNRSGDSSLPRVNSWDELVALIEM